MRHVTTPTGIHGGEKTDETGRLCRMNLAEGNDHRN